MLRKLVTKPRRDQPDLFRDYAPEPPAQAHSRTSRDAAEQIEPAAETLRRQVLHRLILLGSSGATDEELQMFLVMNPSTERPRRIELVEMGLVKDSGRRRRTLSGRNAVVWVAVEKAVG